MSVDKKNYLVQKLHDMHLKIVHSRIHTLKTLGDLKSPCFVKREDELSFGISGTKFRKYLSLLPRLLEDSPDHVIVIGSAFSNNVLGLSQILIENELTPLLFLLGDSIPQPIGNFLLTSLFVPSHQIHWIPRKDWHKIEKIAFEYAKEHLSQRFFIIPEGACMAEALPGALTLSLDILENEKIYGNEFKNVFIESGTGLTAIAVILAFSWLQKSTQVHVLLVAGQSHIFLERLDYFRKIFEKIMTIDLPWEGVLKRFKLHTPTLNRSFGAVNSEIFIKILNLARREGFLTDPIYSAKLFLEAEKIMDQYKLIGPNLIIHSGGALTLMGYQNQLQKALEPSVDVLS
jgi:1-aminocyclopropane-1-carboxylate deaminase